MPILPSALLWALLWTHPLSAADLPEGDGALLVRQQCGICHDLDLVAAQRLSRDQWAGVLDDMKRFGAIFLGDQREALLDYLTAHLGRPGETPVVLAAGLPPGQGMELVRIQCGICHDLNLVRAQRLSRGVWDEVLDDMLEFGAVFNDAQRTVILDYLALHLGP